MSRRTLTAWNACLASSVFESGGRWDVLCGRGGEGLGGDSVKGWFGLVWEVVRLEMQFPGGEGLLSSLCEIQVDRYTLEEGCVGFFFSINLEKEAGDSNTQEGGKKKTSGEKKSEKRKTLHPHLIIAKSHHKY